MVIKTLLGWVPVPGPRTHGEFEVTSVVGRDLHRDLDLLARPVCRDYLPRGELSTRLMFSGPVVWVTTQSTQPTVNVPLDSKASTEPLIVFIVSGRIMAVPPHGSTRGRLY